LASPSSLTSVIARPWKTQINLSIYKLYQTSFIQQLQECTITSCCPSLHHKFQFHSTNLLWYFHLKDVTHPLRGWEF
jgi:hypothetical protein